jgi:hypothetical protein
VLVVGVVVLVLVRRVTLRWWNEEFMLVESSIRS